MQPFEIILQHNLTGSHSTRRHREDFTSLQNQQSFFVFTKALLEGLNVNRFMLKFR